MPPPTSILSWVDIKSPDDLHAFTGWSALPDSFSAGGFSLDILKCAAILWWARITALNIESNDREAFSCYQRLFNQDKNLLVSLYLKQQLDQVNNPSLTPHLLQTLKETATPKIIQYSEQHAAFSADERFNGPRSSSENLLGHINNCLSLWQRKAKPGNPCDAYLSPYISIVGPSGVGKSFAVKQLATRHGQYVIYISFGKVGGLGFPPRSQVADSYNRMGVLDYRSKMERAWERGLTAQILLADCASRMGISPHEFWLLQLDNADFQLKIACLVDNQVLQPTQSPTGQNCLQEECCDLLRPYAHDLNGCMSGNPRGLFIIAIDEARGLFTLGSGSCSGFGSGSGTTGNDTAFRALRTSLSNLSKKFNLFALFLDTTSQVANFSPPATFDSSQKSRVNDEQCKVQLFPPFYQFYTYRLFSPKSINLQDPDISPTTVLRYGHPMLGAFLEAGLRSSDLLEIIRQKLEPNIARDAGALSQVRHLALLLYIVSFEVVNYQYSSKLVSGWMHVLSSISHDRERVVLGQSISPALSLCALEHLSRDHALVNALWDLADKLGWGHVSVGDVGEVVAGLCLVFSVGMSEYEMSPMLLQHFVGRFLNSGVSNALLREPHSQYHPWIKTGKVFFNRVIRFHSSSHRYPTAQDLLYLYSSCCACFLPENTGGMDIIVPVWIPGSPSYVARMGCILIQVKNRQSDTLAPGVRNEAQRSVTDAVKCLAIDTEKTPVLGMLVCLRMSPNGQGGSVVVTAGGGGCRIPVCIGVGLDSGVFSFLEGYPVEVRDALQNLLSIRVNKKYLNDHYVKYVYETTAEDLDSEESRAWDKHKDEDVDMRL